MTLLITAPEKNYSNPSVVSIMVKPSISYPFTILSKHTPMLGYLGNAYITVKLKTETKHYKLEESFIQIYVENCKIFSKNFEEIISR